MLGLVISLSAAVALASGPAMAAVPSSVSSAKPSWSSGIVKATGSSFKTASGSKATYTATAHIYRTTGSSISCTTSSGCSGTGLVQLAKLSWSVSVSGASSYSLPALSANCPAQTGTKQTRYYWSYVKVADAAGSVKGVVSSALSGAYC